MTNNEIADHFSLLSKLMDIHGENSFKSKSYSIAAFNIERLPGEVADMDDAQLFSQKGIGESTGKKIREIQDTGRLGLLDNIIASTPPGILDLLQIKGMGPKKIAQVWKEMGIESVGELEYACNENRLAALKGFGAKSQESILQNIQYFQQNLGFHLWASVEETATHFVTQLRKNFNDARVDLTGPVRRHLETLEYIDIITDADKMTLIAWLQHIPGIEITDTGWLTIHIPEQPKLKIHLTSREHYYQNLFNTTGSAEFLEAFNARYSIPATLNSEEEIFSVNNLQYIGPERRELPGILEFAAADEVKEVIQLSDIRAIIHSHSKWSDGQDTIEAMARAAIDKGYEYLVLSDHSQAAYYADGLKPEQIAAQHIEIDALNEKLKPFKIFKSIEADILGDGSLDYSPQVLETFDLVIASVHSNLKMSQEKAMSRVMAAIRNPFTTILGHPTGRLLLSRAGYPLDHKAVIDACAEYNVVIEINAHPRRLDLDWRWIAYAVEKGVLLSIDPDAHSVNGYKDVYYGVIAAQKGGLTAKQNLSSFTLAEFEAFLEKYRQRRCS
ncbi:MAG: DNA polymerase/3'-5' exonuclease PolX [Bacteroidetes bacterium]|nr:DNA polymerase/3'-5' exonuclease PolX [Bacteroidota bacterium]